MGPSEYRAFTAELIERATREPAVVGLVALGSMAEQDYAPDAFSDHDFFLIVEPGAQERFRAKLSWLPEDDRIVFHFRETEHGLKVLYDHGHLVEFAVFSPDELKLAKVNRYRVLLDRGDLARRLEEVRLASVNFAEGSTQDDRWIAGHLLGTLWIGSGRAARGEELSARMMLGHAVRHLLVLIQKHVPATKPELIDNLDPHRRFELAYPLLGARLRSAMREDAQTLARTLANVAASELGDRVPDFPNKALEIIRRRLG